MLNIASLGMRFNLHNVKCRFARYAFKKTCSVLALIAKLEMVPSRVARYRPLENRKFRLIR